MLRKAVRAEERGGGDVSFKFQIRVQWSVWRRKIGIQQVEVT